MTKTLLLILILQLAFFMSFIPHIGYAYPLTWLNRPTSPMTKPSPRNNAHRPLRKLLLS